MSVHLHFGTGNFGLGFAGQVSKAFGFEFYLANRGAASSPQLSNQNRTIAEQKGYLIQFTDATREHIPVRDVFTPEEPASRDRLVEIISRASLVTTSIRDKAAISTYLPVLEEGLSRRSGNNLAIIAFENGFDSSDIRSMLSPQTQEKAVFPNAVVDRICSSRRVFDQVEVAAEPYILLVLEELPERFKFLFKRPPHFVRFTKEIRYAKKMKTWLMNGAHMLLSIHAHFYGYYEFNKFCAENVQLTRALIDELNVAYRSWLDSELSEGDGRRAHYKMAEDYARHLADRYISSREDVMRLLRDVLDRDRYHAVGDRIFFDIKPIFDKLVNRVSDPVEHYFNAYFEIPPYTGLAMARLNRIIAARANPLAP